MTGAPPRGFARAEFEARTSRAQTLMAERELDGLLVTSEQHVRYFTGFDSQFWASPTRPWFVVVPREGAPIAVIPEIGGPGMAGTWITDIRTWPAPVPEDDGVSLLADTLSALPGRFGRIGAELGPEMVVRMPLADFRRVCDRVAPLEVTDGTAVLRLLRGVKSPAEIDKIRHVCRLTSEAFLALAERLSVGMTEWEACREMRIEVLRRGADSSPYMMGVAGRGGYDNIVMGPTQRVIERDDILIIDTGTTFDGYYCDFDRNFAFGKPGDDVRRAHETVWRATQAGIDAARPGATTTELWRVMTTLLEEAGSRGSNVGRMGHGLGMQLTEWPSNRPGDDTTLAPGMVLTIEPGMEFAPGRMMVHEENIAITEDGCELLTIRAARELPVIG
ncbi:MAG: aminopeptidase P family protein [Rhodospirillales bacterium]|nr:MAG: aminopeptidase P family protein [Rhodospirillales bacterium]